MQRIDNVHHKKILENLEIQIKEHQNDEHKLEKYLWLKDLVNWNINPESSKNKFDYLLK